MGDWARGSPGGFSLLEKEIRLLCFNSQEHFF